MAVAGHGAEGTRTVAQQYQTARAGRPRLRDNFNQLSLFNNGLVKAATEHAGVGDGRKDTAGKDDSQALARELSGHGERAGEKQSPGAGAERSAGTDGGPSARAGLGAEAGLSGGVGDSDAGMGLPPERGPPAATIVHEL